MTTEEWSAQVEEARRGLERLLAERAEKAQQIKDLADELNDLSRAIVGAESNVARLVLESARLEIQEITRMREAGKSLKLGKGNGTDS